MEECSPYTRLTVLMYLHFSGNESEYGDVARVVILHNHWIGLFAVLVLLVFVLLHHVRFVVLFEVVSLFLFLLQSFSYL